MLGGQSSAQLPLSGEMRGLAEASRSCLIWSQRGWRFAGWRGGQSRVAWRPGGRSGAWLDGAEEFRGGCRLGVGSPRLRKVGQSPMKGRGASSG